MDDIVYVLSHGGAALAGQIIGTSLSPEIWIAAAVAITRARTLGQAFAWAAGAALTVVFLRVALVGANAGTQRMAMATLAAMVLWTLIGFTAKRLVLRVRSG